MPVARSLRDRRQSAMKAFLLGASLCLLLPVVTSAQQNKSASDDLSAVRATVRDYIEAYYTGDCRRMEQTLHPHYLKHVIHGNIPMREKQVCRWYRTYVSRVRRTFREQSKPKRSACWTSRETSLPPNLSHPTGWTT